jgi:uracil-DNA glycosylase
MINKLLREIARCPNVSQCFERNGSYNPCGAIVRSQGSKKLALHQLPEPWSGRLEDAPIPFLSSNPSMEQKGEETEEYPPRSWENADIESYFTNRFGGGRKTWITDGIHFLRLDGSYSRYVPFWAFVRQRAKELLQREVKPGVDYALSEVVHCKSQKERGVNVALQECTKRYLTRVIAASGAKVIVVLGSIAQNAVANCVGVFASGPIQGPLKIGNRERLITFIPHSNARTERSFAKCLSPSDLSRLRSVLE